MQNDDLRNKSYKQSLVKYKIGTPRKKKILTSFFQFSYFFVFFFKFLNIVCLDLIQKSHIFYKKNL